MEKFQVDSNDHHYNHLKKVADSILISRKTFAKGSIKLARKIDQDLEDEKARKAKLCEEIEKKINDKIVVLIEKLHFFIRWANPSISSGYKNIIDKYVNHLLTAPGESSLSLEQALDVFFNNARGTTAEKNAIELQTICNELKRLVRKRDGSIEKIHSALNDKQSKQKVRKENRLRWMEETISGHRDKYWTIWYLASHGLNNELLRMINSEKEPFPKNGINEADPDFGFSPLHYACKYDQIETVKILLDHGANPLLTIPDGRTPLHFAAAYADKEVALQLLGHGANCFAKDRFLCTPYDLAHQNGNKKMCDLLERWDNLLPPISPPQHEEIIDLCSIPEEYRKTPIDFYNKMSSTLKLLTDRLDGKDAHSFDLVMDSSIEMRLCTKHANQCFQESLIFECIKSLRRRWFVAKKSLQFDNNASEYSISGTPHNVHLLLNYGRCLAEELIKFGFEGYAGAILNECVHIKGLDTVTVVGNICRYCEVQMCVHDLLIALRGKENNRTRSTPPLASDCVKSYLLNGDIDLRLENIGYDAMNQRLDSLLLDCYNYLQRALALMNTMHERDIVEPCTIFPILDLIGEMSERHGDFVDALTVMKHAYVISCRSLGKINEESVRLGVQVLRLSIKCVNKDGLKYAARKATEVARDLDELKLTNPTYATKLGLQCVELISLCRLLEEGIISRDDENSTYQSIGRVLSKPLINEVPNSGTSKFEEIIGKYESAMNQPLSELNYEYDSVYKDRK